MLMRLARAGDRGQLIPFVALAMVGILMMTALAVDVGYWRYQQRLTQSAADSAALAGAISLDYSTSAYTAAGQADAATNGFTDDKGVTVSVTMNKPPASGSYTTTAGAVEAVVQKKQPVFFAGIFGLGYQWVSARAVAAPNAAGRDCVTTLDPSGSITINGGPKGFLAPTCDIISDGSFTANGSGVVDARAIGYATPATAYSKGGTFPEASPAPSIPATDPCLVIPSCDALLTTAPSGLVKNPAPIVSGGYKFFFPGEYTAAPALDGKSTNVFCGAQSGGSPVYLLDAGLSAKGGDTIVDLPAGVTPPQPCSVGVTLYNAGGSINFTGTSSISLTAPGGSQTGTVLFQPATNYNDVTISGGGTYGLQGGIYAPGTPPSHGATVTLNGSLPALSFVTAGSIAVNGDGITIGSSSSTPSALGHVVLAE